MHSAPLAGRSFSALSDFVSAHDFQGNGNKPMVDFESEQTADSNLYGLF